MTRFIECDICGKDCQDRSYTPLFGSNDEDELSLFPSLAGVQDVCTECLKEIDIQILTMIEIKDQQRKGEGEDE